MSKGSFWDLCIDIAIGRMSLLNFNVLIF